MRTEDLILLVKAGYTKEDIEKMTADASPVPAPQPTEESPTEEPAEPEKPEPQPDPVMTELKALKDQISKMSITQNAADIPNEEDKLKAALAKLIGG